MNIQFLYLLLCSKYHWMEMKRCCNVIVLDTNGSGFDFNLPQPYQSPGYYVAKFSALTIDAFLHLVFA